MWLLTCHMQMLPRLQAEEALQAVQVRNASDVNVDRATRSRIIRRWQTIANAGESAHHGVWLSDMTPVQQRAALARVGLHVVN